MGSDTMGLKVVSSLIRIVEVVDTVKGVWITINLVVIRNNSLIIKHTELTVEMMRCPF